MSALWFRIPGWVRVVLAAFAIIGVVGLTIGYLTWQTQSTEEATCLSYTIDGKLDALALIKGEQNRAVAEQQAEIIARKHIRVSKGAGLKICPESFSRWLAWSRYKYIFGAKNDSERWQLIYPVAIRALSGSYKYPLPPGCSDIKEYRQTRVRGWMAEWRNRGQPGFSVGNMHAFCM